MQGLSKSGSAQTTQPAAKAGRKQKPTAFQYKYRELPDTFSRNMYRQAWLEDDNNEQVGLFMLSVAGQTLTLDDFGAKFLQQEAVTENDWHLDPNDQGWIKGVIERMYENTHMPTMTKTGKGGQQ